MNNTAIFHIGVVEDRADPLKIGRCKVRVTGVHTYDKNSLPTSDLPWAVPLQPVTSASISGIGTSPNGLVEGSTVMVIFQDHPTNQYPVIVGSIAGIPQPDGVIIGSTSVTPLMSDGITPSGRPFPLSRLGSDAGISGLIHIDLMDNNDPLLSLCGEVKTPLGYDGILDVLRYGNAVSRSSNSSLGLFTVGLGRGFNKLGDAIEAFLLDTGSVEHTAKSAMISIGRIDPNRAKSVLYSIPNKDIALLGIDNFEDALSSVSSAELGSSISLGDIILASPLPTTVGGLTNSGEVIPLEKPNKAKMVSLEGSDGLALLDEADIILRGSESYKDLVEADGEGGTPSLFGAFGGVNNSSKPPKARKATPDRSVYVKTEASRAINAVTPPWFKGADPSKGIAAIVSAASKHSLSSAQTATLLAIIGVETEWHAVEESTFYYSPEVLCRRFPQAFNGDVSLASAYCNWKGGKEDFFNFVYHPSRQGRKLGNVKPNDGSKFIGRGLLPIIGRSMYKRYSEITNKSSILDEPEKVSSDINIAAEVAVLYFLDNVVGIPPTSHPQFFYSAVKRFGRIDDISILKKREYYEHFYGAKTPEWFGFDNKVSGNAIPPKSFHGVKNFSNRVIDGMGFKDPNSKYPLGRMLKEPDTNRLARGIASETAVQIKESKRSLGIPVALDGGFWDQPPTPYSASYPHNHVLETESGHLQEFDDTPGSERLHWYHRKGTFVEWDSNGNEVRKIVGNGYTIIDKNGFISIEGDCNLTVGGRVNILCKSDANIEVSGSAEMKIGGNMDVGVAGDMNIATGGNFSVWSNGAMNLQSKNNTHVISSDLFLTSNKSTYISASSNTFIESTGAAHLKAMSISCESSAGAINLKSASVLALESGADFTTKSGGSIMEEATTDIHIKAGGAASLGATGVINVKAEASVVIDGAATLMQMALATPPMEAPPAEAASGSVRALLNSMTPPVAGSRRLLESPWNTGSTQFCEDKIAMNTGIDTNISRMVTLDTARTNRLQNTFKSKTHKSSGGGNIVTLADEDIILSTQTFDAGFRLSDNFTLGMLFDGGYGFKHRLTPYKELSVQEIVCNLTLLCRNILENCLPYLPDGIRGIDKSWRIASGYRMARAGDEHATGKVVDIAILGANDTRVATFDLAKRLSQSIPFSQMSINYHGDLCWISIGYYGEGTYGEGEDDGRVYTTRDFREVAKELTLLG